MQVMVTGATGFVGQALCAALVAGGHTLTRLSSANADLTRSGALDEFGGVKYDRIFHLAAWTQAGDFCLSHPGEQWLVNQQINTNMLAWWHERQPQAKLICVGTSCAYAPDGPLVEERYLSGVPVASLLAYAMAKRMMYVGLVSLRRQYGLSYLHVVPSTLYGPGYHTDGRQMHFIFDVVRKIIRAKLYGEPAVLWGDGYQRRELLYLDDFLRALLHLADTCESESVNIGAGEEHTIRHFAELVCGIVGVDAEVVRYDTSRHVGARSKCLDTTKLNRLMPGLVLTPLQAGLVRTTEWLLTERAALLAP